VALISGLVPTAGTPVAAAGTSSTRTLLARLA